MNTREKVPFSVAYYLFILLLLFTPVAFGTVEAWSQCVAYGLVALSAICVFFRKTGESFREIPGIIPLVFLLLYMIAQVIPLPADVIHDISPKSYDAYLPVMQAAGGFTWIPISVNARETVYEIVRLSSFILIYASAVQIFANGQRQRKIIEIIIIFVVIIAFMAILQKLTVPDLIYWFREVPDNARNFGPWVSRSQYSGFMLMIFPLLLGLYLYFRPTVDEEDSLRVRIAILLSGGGNSRHLLAVLGVIILFLSILLSMSRSGIAISIISFLLFFILISKIERRRFWGLLFIFLGAIFVFFYSFGVEEFAERFNDTFDSDGTLSIGRFVIWHDCIQIIKDFPVFGSGFGTFIDVYPMYRTVVGSSIFDHVHNDYIELVTDGGILGFVLVAWFILSIIRVVWRKARLRRDNYARIMSVAGTVSICSMLFYSITDFNMHNFTNGMYFFIICAFSVSVSHTRFKYQRGSSLLPSLKKHVHGGFVVGSCLFLIGVFAIPVAGLYSSRLYKDVSGIYLNPHLSQQKLSEYIAAVKQADRFDPLNGVYSMILGNIETLKDKNDTALSYYLTAAQRNPLRGEFLQKIALMVVHTKPELADELMELSYIRSLRRDERMLVFAEWLYLRGEKARAVLVLHEVLTQNISLLKDIAYFLDSYFTTEEIARILPQDVRRWLWYGRYLEKLGRIEESEYFRRNALDYIDKEVEIYGGWYKQIYNFYMKHGKKDKAVEIIKMAAEKLPDKPFFHILLGDYYAQEGIVYRARDEYEQALLFDPGNEKIQKRLERLAK